MKQNGQRSPSSKPRQPKQKHKILVIGLDGATFDLIKPWAEEGHLPAINRILSYGVHGNMRSTIPPMTAPAWSSFATGTNPGKHRLYDWIAREPGSYRFTPITALDAKMPTIYNILSQAGLRVCSLNVPMTYPPAPINGVMVSGMPAPSARRTITYPPELYQDILTTIGDYILYPDPGQAYSASGIDAFLKRLYRCTDLRIQTFDYLRSKEEWDFAMLVFSGTDTICHAMWKYMDRNHPMHDPSKSDKYGSAIQDFYQYVDAYLAEVTDNLDDDTTLFIMSDHGFGPFHKFIHVNNWLINQGFMSVKSAPKSQLKKQLFSIGFSPMNVYDIMMKFGMGAFKREVVRGQGQGLLKALFLSFEDIDWENTVAYSMGNIGQIYINVAGREPQGCVQPGIMYEQIRDKLITRLKDMRDPETGVEVVESVYRREEIYSGDQLTHAPDIVFIPRRLEYFGFGEYEFGSHKIIEAMKRGISGTHRLNGIFMAYGKAIESRAQLNKVHLIDLAPTILYMLGLPIPDHMDGEVLHNILQESFHPERSNSPQEWHQPVNDLDGEMTEQDKAVLADRLRDLGYVG